MKDLKFIQACPSDIYYTWQVNLWLESLKDIGHSDKAISVIFTPKGRENRDKWKQIEDLYPEAEFHYYTDEDNLNQLLGIYIPVLRPYVLWKHFKAFPELNEKSIFYCDSDILFMKNFNVDQFLESREATGKAANESMKKSGLLKKKSGGSIKKCKTGCK